MAAYFVYLFSSEAVIERVESYDCPTTQEAEAECERRADGRYAELWHNGHRIRAVNQEAAPGGCRTDGS